jgi:hypothetical protein
MRIISHRGNLDGRIPESENHPDYIKQAIVAGFDVEIDVWCINGEFMLGHDDPHYAVDVSFLKNPFLWCHAKNADALEKLLEEGVHCFWHESDTYTITSRGSIWCYVGKYHKKGIAVNLGEPTDPKDSLYGVCTDYPIKWKKRR